MGADIAIRAYLRTGQHHYKLPDSSALTYLLGFYLARFLPGTHCSMQENRGAGA
jgi:hypothetical protein